MIKIAVSGALGRMGQAVIKALDNFDKISLGTSIKRNDDLNLVLDKFNVLIDYTHPNATIDYVNICLQAKKPIVIGTTGFNNDKLQIIYKAATKIPIVLAPNMSVGVALMLELLKNTAKAIGKDADIEIVETHHRHKKDAPSGTALKMGDTIANALGRKLKQCAIYDHNYTNKPRDKTSIGFSSIRGGDIVGEHIAHFFMDGECIQITHKAYSRTIFANGAIKAANWLISQPIGLYSMQDVLGYK